ncbi:MAG: MlaD family protein [Calditerrivibrio sp.]|nr:MlaD family protein [Calditerrivibrio sp.]
MADPRFKGIEIKVGIFILFAILSVLVVLGLVAINKNILTTKVRLIIYSNDGDGLSNGMPVIFSGFQIGRIQDLNLEDDGRVKMVVKIPDDYVKWIKKDSECKLESKNLLGASSITFSGGKDRVVKDDDKFFLVRSRGLEELIEKAKPVIEDAKVIVANVRSITDDLKDKNGDLAKLMRGLGNVGDDLTLKRGTLGKLIRTEELNNKIEKITDNVVILQKNLNEISTKVSNIMDKVGERVDGTEETLKEVNSLMKKSNELIIDVNKRVKEIEPILKNTENISKNIAETSDNLSQIKKEADEILNSTNRLLINLEQRWPFSSGSNKSEGSLKIP